MPSQTDPYWEPLAIRRETLFWVVATRIQLRRWEVAHAPIVRAAVIEDREPDGAAIWEAQRERHLTFVAARNLVRALNLDGQEVELDKTLNVMHWGRDLLEHWDENMPIFNQRPRPRDPKFATGRNYAERYEDHSPFSFGAWRGDEGPLLTPDLSVAELHSILDEVEAQILTAAPHMRQYLKEPPPSPWTEEGWPARSLE